MKLFAAAAAFAALVLGQNDGKTQLKVGDMAPDFTLRAPARRKIKSINSRIIAARRW